MFNPEEFTAAVLPWIRERVEAAGAFGVVLGLSGGIDSAVVAHLCHRALGPNDAVKVVWLGCESSEEEFLDAQLVAGGLNLDLHLLDLATTLDALTDTLSYGDDLVRLTRGNIKSRLRMVALYAIANNENLTVVGTGDKSEDEIGYFTKYGDGGVDFLPIADLLKTEVRELGRYLGVPEQVITKPSSPGLWAGQTAEGELGFTYEEVDKVISGSPGATPEAIKRVSELKAGSEHKRNYPPIFPWPSCP